MGNAILSCNGIFADGDTIDLPLPEGVRFELPLTCDGRPAGTLLGTLRAEVRPESSLEKGYLQGMFHLTGAPLQTSRGRPSRLSRGLSRGLSSGAASGFSSSRALSKVASGVSRALAGGYSSPTRQLGTPSPLSPPLGESLDGCSSASDSTDAPRRTRRLRAKPDAPGGWFCGFLGKGREKSPPPDSKPCEVRV